MIHTATEVQVLIAYCPIDMEVMENIERPRRLTMTMIHTATEVQVLIAYCPIEDMVVLVDMVMDSMVALEALADIVHMDLVA